MKGLMGTGKPDGLKGENNPLGARIIASFYSIYAMTSNRRYRKELGFDVCYQEIEKNLGKMYDPIIGQYVLDHFDKVTACLHKNVAVKAV